MVDYSKFDKIDVDSDAPAAPPLPLPTHPPSSSSPPAPTTTAFPLTQKGQKGTNRLKFVHQGQTVYEWEQTLEDVTLYIQPPPGVKAAMIKCTITPAHLTLGLKGAPHPFIDEDTAGSVKTAESFWTMEDGELHIQLTKMKKGEVWASALAGQGQLDPITTEDVKKKLMLERFQEENPGFDFSNAEFNGVVPDPQRFMGGVKY